MAYVTVHVDADEVLEDLSDSDIDAILKRRRKAPIGSCEVYDDELLEQAYWYFRDHGGAPECLREYIYRKLGKTLG